MLALSCRPHGHPPSAALQGGGSCSGGHGRGAEGPGLRASPKRSQPCVRPTGLSGTPQGRVKPPQPAVHTGPPSLHLPGQHPGQPVAGVRIKLLGFDFRGWAFRWPSQGGGCPPSPSPETTVEETKALLTVGLCALEGLPGFWAHTGQGQSLCPEGSGGLPLALTLTLVLEGTWEGRGAQGPLCPQEPGS